MSNKIVLIKSNTAEYDPRLKKEIDSLVLAGFIVNLLCWDRDRVKAAKEDDEAGDRYKETRFPFKAPIGPKILPFLPLWWCFELYHLLKRDFDVIHAINFDSIIPAIIAARIKGVPIIYEMFDIYADEILLPRILRSLCLGIDKVFMRASDAVIIVDDVRIEEVDGIPNDNISVIYNSPQEFPQNCDNYSSNGEFTLFYAGLLNRYRSIENVIEAVLDLDNVKLIIAGFGDLEDQIKKTAEANPNKLQFIGKISHTEVLSISCSADLLFSLYDPAVPSNKFASSNKIFEAMMCGKPILISEGTSMADIARRCNCGIVVDCRDIDLIKDAIYKLKEDKRLCVHLGRNGRKAYEEKYSWRIMEQRLANVYRNIFINR